MNKQTSVEWLEQKIEKLLPDFIIFWQEEFEHAKAMEREQIVKAWEYGCMTNYGDAQTYYNETYKGGEQ